MKIFKLFLFFLQFSVLALLSLPLPSQADMGLEIKDFKHKEVSGKEVKGEGITGKRVTGEGVPIPGDNEDGKRKPDDDGDSEGEIGRDTPICQTDSGNGQTEGTACGGCEGYSTENSCNPDHCIRVYSHVNLFTREYQDDVVDMKVKVPGGYLKVHRLYAGGKWQFEHEYNRLDLSKEKGGVIGKAGLKYSRGEDGKYHYRTFSLEKRGEDYRWQNKWGDYVLYNLKGYIIETGNRTGTLSHFHYKEEKLVSIHDRNNTPVFHFNHANGKLSYVGDEHDRVVHYTWEETNLTRVKDVLGHVTTYTYDEEKRLSQKQDEAGRHVFVAYHKNGAVASVLSGLGGGDSFSYSHDDVKNEFYAKAISAMGKTREYWFDAQGETKRIHVNGNLVRKEEWLNGKKIITDEMGNRITRSYDLNFNLIREEFADGSFRQFNYDRQNNLISTMDENGVESRFTYNERGLRKASRIAYSTPEESLTEYQYDEDGNLEKELFYLSDIPVITKHVYDKNGNRIRTINGLGAQRRYQYDYMGNIVKSVTAMGLEESLVYDKKGQRIKTTTSGGQNHYYFFDQVGRLVEIKDDVGRVAKFVHDHQDNIVEKVDALGGIRRFNFDKDNRLTKRVDEEGIYTIFFYGEGSSRISKIIDGNGNEIKITYGGFENCGSCSKTFRTNPVLIEYPTFSRQFVYNTRGHLIQRIENIGGNQFSERYTYDKVGNILTYVDRSGRISKRQYDSLNRVVAETDPAGNTIKFGYNKQNRLTRIVDGNGGVNRFEYDRIGRRIKEIKPLGNSLTFSYDADGRLASRTDSKGQKISYMYNVKNGYLDAYALKKNENDFLGDLVKFKYDKHGRIVEYNDQTTSAQYEYDRLGRRIKEKLDYGEFSASHSYAYFRNGKKKRYRGPDGLTHIYRYNPIGEIESIDIENIGTVSYSNYKWIQPQTIIFPGGQRLDQFDDALRLIKRKATSSKGEDILDLAYAYDANSNIISRKSPEISAGYIYDESRRLTEVKQGGIPVETFNYDKVGNRLASGEITFSYNADNQLLSGDTAKYQYDKNGSPILVQAGSEERHLSYSIENRLQNFRRGEVAANYYYDPYGRRLSKVVNGKRTWFYYTEDGLVAEFDAQGKLQTSYSYQPDSLWSNDPLMMSQSGKHYFYQNDHLGTPNRITDLEGKIVWSGSHNAFGEMEIEEQVIVNNLRLPGQYYDKETGLHYNWNRYYNPKIGRYLTVDPLGFAGGDINLYAYVWADPINYLDPLGLFMDGRRKENKKWGYLGHSDFFGGDRFDFTKEDYGSTAPWPWASPENHFQEKQKAIEAIEIAMDNCDLDKFERAMHRGQDYFSHRRHGYQWDPGNTDLPCNGFGHACWNGRNADKHKEDWLEAEEFTRGYVLQYINRCGCPPKLPEHKPPLPEEEHR